MKLWFNVTKRFISINLELVKQSMAAVLHDISDLNEFIKIKIPTIMNLINISLLLTFNGMKKYTN